MTADRTDMDPTLAEFVDLWGADTADDLHRVLVLYSPVRSTADAYEPFSLLSKHHEKEPQTSTVTALLLVTDHRWSKGTSRLIRAIAESGMISEDNLTVLARTFVAADEYVYWQLPEAWLADALIEIDIGNHTGDPTEATAEAAVDEDQPTVAARRVYPPLRRWAAGYLVARGATTWGALLSTARRRRGAAGAAVMSGLLDGIAYLPDPAQKLIVDTGVAWPKAEVRKHALGLLADRGDRQFAHDLAQRDKSAAIRRTATSLLGSPLTSDGPLERDDEPPQRRLFSD